jgi:hypothetical protein
MVAFPLLATAATLAAVALASPAASQTSSSQANQNQFLTEQPPATLRLSKVRGVEVIGQDHTRIGTIDDVLLDQEGRVRAVVIGAGGVLRIGGKNVAIPFDQILWNTGEVARVEHPSASVAPGDPRVAEARNAAAERMPGSETSNQVLAAVPEGRSGVVDPATGPVTTGATDRATIPVSSREGVERAFVRLTRAEMETAPEFRYQDR